MPVPPRRRASVIDDAAFDAGFESWLSAAPPEANPYPINGDEGRHLAWENGRAFARLLDSDRPASGDGAGPGNHGGPSDTG